MGYVIIIEKTNIMEYKENYSSRKYNISKKKGEWFNAEVTDSYGENHQNYFETYEEANKWVHYIWENEEIFQNDKMESLTNAVWGCIKLDEELGLIRNNRDNLD